jgi:hypothetical protein
MEEFGLVLSGVSSGRYLPIALGGWPADFGEVGVPYPDFAEVGSVPTNPPRRE